MPPITALLHTANDERRLGRALETLFPCAEILVVDHSSTDQTARIARKYGARVVPAISRAASEAYLDVVRNNWVLCLAPSESITESLQATLLEWSSLPDTDLSGSSFCLSVREQIGDTWQTLPMRETRLIPKDWAQWNGPLPEYEASSISLEGELIRLSYP
jgi:glycosyltransferase involved in cell wall biosynthesis